MQRELRDDTLAVGGEVQKQRPAVIVSNDAANNYLKGVQVVPLTTSVDRLYPSAAAVMVRHVGLPA